MLQMIMSVLQEVKGFILPVGRPVSMSGSIFTRFTCFDITDTQLMAVSGDVHVDTTDIGCSDHFLVWVELGRAAKNSKKGKRVIRRWRLDRFGDDEVKLRYQNGLRAEVHGFSESIKRKVEVGMKGHDLVNEVLREWESIVNRVAKREVGDKMIVCGRAAKWWDNEIKEKISLRRVVLSVRA